MSLAAGTRLGPYEITSRIGAGGMGEVYLAHDERLDRDVALKVLAADVLGDPAAVGRFQREARALSRLNHPNIAAVYDFDTHGGVSILAMEYVSGRGVGEIVERGPVAESELIDLALQLADGLVAAHREAVVHRDLKPGNLRLTPDGRLKILDFGLAKVTAPVSADEATRSATGTLGVVGTLPYMAPEQLRGGPIDERTDIYAAGVVLYELATGRRPFTEPVTPALVDAIFHAQPVAPRQLRGELSPVLEAIIVKCLEKDAAFRYQSATALLTDLKRYAARLTAVSAVAVPVPAVSTAAAPRRTRARRVQSLAVLPFDNFSRDPSQQYFVDGMTETLTTCLAQITSIRVIGRTSAMRFGGPRKPPIPEIAGALGVDAVVEGSVLREGDRVRITAQLVAAHPERHVWSNSYDRDLKDVLEIHSEVSKAIAREVRATLSPHEKARLSRMRPVNPEAYQVYLRGRQALGRLGPQGFAEADKAFNQAIALDPTFAPAYSGLAALRLWTGVTSGAVPPRIMANQARTAVAKALELDPLLAEALSAEGVLNLYADWDWATASTRIRRTLELNPSEGALYHPYADYLLMQGKLEESVDYCRRWAELDPFSPMANSVVAKHLSFLRRWDEVIPLLDRAIALTPEPGLVRGLKASALWEKGELAGAIAEWSLALPGPLAAVLQRGYAEGGPRAAVRTVAQALMDASLSNYVSPYNIASWFAAAGDAQPTLDWLEKAYEDRTPFLLHMKAEPAFDFVRSDGRFQAIVERIGFPDAASW